MNELCGQPTSTGKPCNMPKGHSAKFHRHREYDKRIKWTIKNSVDKILEEGNGRRELGYAMTRWINSGVTLVIEVNA
jgi:hypothetical protein